MTDAVRGATGFTAADLTRDVTRLAAAELYWVTPAMTRLALDASADLPDWTPGEAVPAPFGLLVWDGDLPALPWAGAPDRGHTIGPLGDRRPPQVPVSGVAWAPHHDQIILSPLARTAALADLLVPRWQAAALFPFAEVRVPRTRVEDMTGVAAGFVAAVGATWLLMQQPTVTEPRALDTHTGEQATGRPSVAASHAVTLIDLRRHAAPDREPPEQGQPSRRFTRRWLVRGHWRQQAYGPGRALRRPTWVPPHVKGPDGAPLVETEHVLVWRR